MAPIPEFISLLREIRDSIHPEVKDIRDEILQSKQQNIEISSYIDSKKDEILVIKTNIEKDETDVKTYIVSSISEIEQIKTLAEQAEITTKEYRDETLVLRNEVVNLRDSVAESMIDKMTEEEADLLYVRKDANEVSNLENKIFQTNDTVKTIKVPTDFSTVKEAIDTQILKYGIGSNTKAQEQITILIESGYVWKDSIVIDSLNASFITISSEDDTVGGDTTTINEAALKIINTTGPIWDIILDLREIKNTGVSGMMIIDKAFQKINAGKGIKNAGDTGIYVSSGGYVDCQSAIIEGSKGNGVHIEKDGYMYGRDMQILNSGQRGIRLVGGKINATGVIIDGTIIAGILAVHGSSIDIESSKISNVGAYGIYASDLSNVHCKDSVFTNIRRNTANVYGLSSIYMIGSTGDISLSQTSGIQTEDGIIYN